MAQAGRKPGGSLTFRQRLFVYYYLGEARGNATEAARLAGYSDPNGNAHRLTVNDGVRAAIDSQVSDAAISAPEVLARLTEHATADMAEFVNVDARGGITLDFKKAKDADRLRLVKKIVPNKYGLTLELYDAQSALTTLAKYHGLLDKVDVDKLSQEVLQRIAQADQGGKGGAGEAPGPEARGG